MQRKSASDSLTWTLPFVGATRKCLYVFSFAIPSSRRACPFPRGGVEPGPKERKRPLVGLSGGALIVGIGTAMVGEGMADARIDVGSHIRIAGNRREDARHVFRGGVIALTEMQDQRPADLAALGEEILDACAVISDAGIRVGASCRQVRHGAPEAEAPHADAAGAGAMAEQMRDAGLH